MATADLLEPIVRLRVLILETRDPLHRDELRTIEASLRSRLGPAVPKRAAARLLGVSVTALDRWLDRGVLPAVASPRQGSRRLGVETGPLLELATKVRQLRRSGLTRGVLAQAVRRLGWRERGRRLVLAHDVARLPRPNVPLDELQQRFRATTPEERVLQLAALNRSLNGLLQDART
jgi:DNA-binding transcriptional MerR regulator